MRLADFIEQNMEAILAEWEAFAATQLPAAATMHRLALRDHAEQILGAICQDMQTAQSRQTQILKSRGLAPAMLDAPETAAQTHALLRAQSGFDINQLAAEYRALRASVLRLWMDHCDPGMPHLQDMVRFHEAIDQALAESITFFSEEVEQSRNLLLGMLAHDMRTPLQMIFTTAQLLELTAADPAARGASRRLLDAAGRIKSLLSDLMDLGRSQLGVSLPVRPLPVDLAKLLTTELDQLRAVYPDSTIALRCTGDLAGAWDGGRVQQMVQNIVVNAVKYGLAGTPIEVSAAADERDVAIAVSNAGPPIASSRLESLFDPLRRGVSEDDSAVQSEGLGLGLYIAREIARAHGGDVTAISQDGRTTFTCRLPRRSRPM